MMNGTHDGLRAIVGGESQEDVDAFARRLGRVGHWVIARASVPTLIYDAVRESDPEIVVLGQRVGRTDGLDVARAVCEIRTLPIIQVIDEFDAPHNAPGSPAEVSFVGRDASDAEWSIRIERARSQHELRESLRGRVDHLTRRLHHARTIARAKGRLMDELGLDENSAYGKIRRASQDRRIPLERVAEEILTRGVRAISGRTR